MDLAFRQEKLKQKDFAYCSDENEKFPYICTTLSLSAVQHT